MNKGEMITKDKAINQVRKWTDGAGTGLDPNIESTIAALYRLGITTTASCEGHLNHGLPYPWVELEVREVTNLRELLIKHPLRGFRIVEFSNIRPRLQPVGAPEATGQILRASYPAEENSGSALVCRQKLIERLETNQELIRSWGEKLLELKAKGF